MKLQLHKGKESTRWAEFFWTTFRPRQWHNWFPLPEIRGLTDCNSGWQWKTVRTRNLVACLNSWTSTLKTRLDGWLAGTRKQGSHGCHGVFLMHKAEVMLQLKDIVTNMTHSEGQGGQKLKHEANIYTSDISEHQRKTATEPQRKGRRQSILRLVRELRNRVRRCPRVAAHAIRPFVRRHAKMTLVFFGVQRVLSKSPELEFKQNKIHFIDLRQALASEGILTPTWS